MNDKATPRPWEHRPDLTTVEPIGGNGFYFCPIYSGNGLCGYGRGPTRQIAIDNAALIVKAINEYDALCAVAEAAANAAEHVAPSSGLFLKTRLQDALSELATLRKESK